MPSLPTRIVHLTDVHFGRDHAYERKGASAATRHTFLEMLVADVESACSAPDLVIISGDLVSIGSRDEFLSARAFLDDLSKAFSLKPEHFLVIPGNHDIYWGKGPDATSRGEYEGFYSAFFNVPVTEATLPVRTVGNALFVGLDTTRLDRQSTSGIGLIGQDQLHGALKKIRQLLSPETLAFLVLHHHLLPVAWIEPGEPAEPVSLTLDAQTVLGWAQENGFSGVLHGHQHQSFLTTFHNAAKRNGPILVAGGPSAGAKDLPPQGRNGYHLFHIDGRRITVSLREASEEGRFVEARKVTFVRESTGTFAASSLPPSRRGRELSTVEIRALALQTVHSIRETVAASYGPNGGLRITSGLSGQRHVRDGHLIARSLTNGDPVQARIAAMATALAHDMGVIAGGGRKTAVLLWCDIVSNGIAALQAGANDSELIRDIRAASITALENLNLLTKPAGDTELPNIAATAALGEPNVGEAIVSAFKAGGKEGLVAIVRSAEFSEARAVTMTAKVHTVSGLVFPPWFLEVLGDFRTINNPALLLYDDSLGFLSALHILEKCAQARRPMIIVCTKVEDDLSAAALVNIQRAALKVLPLSMTLPAHRGVLEDLSVLSGARVYSSKLSHPITSAALQDLGCLTSATVSGDDLSVEPDASIRPVLLEAVRRLRAARDSSSSDYAKQQLQVRLARLVGAEVELRVTGVNEADVNLFVPLVSDALQAAYGATESGCVQGAGRALGEAAKALGNVAAGTGAAIVQSALRVPASLIAEQNGVLDSSAVVRSAIRLAVESAVRALETRTIETAAGVQESTDQADPDPDLRPF